MDQGRLGAVQPYACHTQTVLSLLGAALILNGYDRPLRGNHFGTLTARFWAGLRPSIATNPPTVAS